MAIRSAAAALPSEVVERVMGLLGLRDQLAMSSTCSAWRAVSISAAAALWPRLAVPHTAASFDARLESLADWLRARPGAAREMNLLYLDGLYLRAPAARALLAAAGRLDGLGLDVSTRTRGRRGVPGAADLAALLGGGELAFPRLRRLRLTIRWEVACLALGSETFPALEHLELRFAERGFYDADSKMCIPDSVRSLWVRVEPSISGLGLVAQLLSLRPAAVRAQIPYAALEELRVDCSVYTSDDDALARENQLHLAAGHRFTLANLTMMTSLRRLSLYGYPLADELFTLAGAEGRAPGAEPDLCDTLSKSLRHLDVAFPRLHEEEESAYLIMRALLRPRPTAWVSRLTGLESLALSGWCRHPGPEALDALKGLTSTRLCLDAEVHEYASD